MNIIVMSLNPSIDWQWSVPSFVYGGLNRAKNGERYASGKGINVCAALKNIGLDPLCIGFNFRENGDFLTNALDEWGIRHDFITVDGAVRTNIKLYDDSTGEMTELNQPGTFVPGKAMQALYEKFDVAIDTIADKRQPIKENGHISRYDDNNEAAIIVISGSMPAGVPADTYKRLCEAWPGKVILDADGEALRLALMGGKPPFCIKPNLHELTNLACMMNCDVDFSKREGIAAFCRELTQSYGVSMICVSMGEKGAMLVTDLEDCYIPAPKLTVRGVQGAGDAMVAGLAYGLAQGLMVPELLHTATAAAAATVERDGTLMCTREGFRKYLAMPLNVNQEADSNGTT